MLFTMDQPGVETRPIRLISGASPFCETFFDNAVAEKANLVHRLNQGWTVAKRLLQHERSGIHMLAEAATSSKRTAIAGMTLTEAARHYVGTSEGLLVDPILRDQIVQHQMNARAFSLTQARTVEESEGGTPTFATSIFKFYGAEVRKRQLELQLLTRGTQSLGWEGEAFTPEEQAITRTWLGSKAGSIAGGSNEVQLNIVSKRVLGLPE